MNEESPRTSRLAGGGLGGAAAGDGRRTAAREASASKRRANRRPTPPAATAARAPAAPTSRKRRRSIPIGADGSDGVFAGGVATTRRKADSMMLPAKAPAIDGSASIGRAVGRVRAATAPIA